MRPGSRRPIIDVAQSWNRLAGSWVPQDAERRGSVNQVGYVQRICNDQNKIDRLLKQAPTGVLGMVDGSYPYVVPLNFIWSNGFIYIHGMGSGKREQILPRNPQVCFTVFKEMGTVTDPMPCHADTAYISVMLFGRAERVTDSAEAASVLQMLVEKYLPGYYNSALTSSLLEKYRSTLDGNGVAVYRIIPEEITAKENEVAGKLLFEK
jgi:Predicted flavin-nucleotide-binding protein